MEDKPTINVSQETTRPSIQDPLIRKARSTFDTLIPPVESYKPLIQKEFKVSQHDLYFSFESHHLSSESILRNCNGNVPDIIFGELQIENLPLILGTDFEAEATSLIQRMSGFGGSKEDAQEHLDILRGLQDETTYICADSKWEFNKTQGRILDLIQYVALGNSFKDFAIAGINAGKGLKDKVEEKKQPEVPKISRRNFLKLASAATFVGLSRAAIGTIAPALENDAYVPYNEGMIHLRNLNMVQNYWNVISRLQEEPTSVYFFAANGHAGCVDLLQKGKDFTEKSLKEYATIFLAKSAPMVTDSHNQTESAVLLAKYASIFENLYSVGSYNLKQLEDVPPSPRTIFVKEVVDYTFNKGQGDSKVLLDMLKHMSMNQCETESPLYHQEIFGYTPPGQGVELPHEILLSFAESTNDPALDWGETRDGEKYTWRGVASVSGQSYPIIEQTSTRQRYIELPMNQKVPLQR